MTDKRSFEERSREFEVSLINQPIDYVVDFAVKETAVERAWARWFKQSERQPDDR
jgi:hypothetical protein